MQVKKQQLELDMEQQTGSKLRKKYDNAVYFHPDYLTAEEYTTQNAGLDELQAVIFYSFEQIWPEVSENSGNLDSSLCFIKPIVSHHILCI